MELVKIVKQEHIEVIHCQDASSCILAGYANRVLKKKVKVIWHLRGIGINSYKKMVRLNNLFDMTICNSYSERNLLIMNNFVPEKTCVIYNAIEEQRVSKCKKEIRSELGIEQHDYVIGTVGRLVRFKGIHYLLMSVAKLNNPNIKILIVGDGPQRQELETLSKEFGIKDKTIFAGLRRDMGDMYAAMDLFALPTLRESFGNVIVEAMLSKVPVLASYVGGIPEIINDGVNGFMAPVADVNAWSESIIKIYDNRNKMNDMTELAYRQAKEKYNMEVFYRCLMNIYGLEHESL
jgi:glycosyltransferase involved in cell wall biosynthesis